MSSVLEARETSTTSGSSRGRARLVGPGLVVVLLLAFPFIASSFWLTVAVFCAIAASGALSLNLLVGYAGQVSVGHAFFLGVGAYVGAYGGQHGWSFPVIVLAAIGLPALVGLLVGPVALRLRELYLAITTLGLVYVGQWVVVAFDGVTGGTSGTATTDLKVFGFDLGTSAYALGLPMTRDVRYYFAALALAALIGFAIYNLGRTRPGRAMMAVRDRQVAASVAGVDVTRYKLWAFTVSSGMAGATGLLYGSYLGYLVPETFSLELSITYLAMIIIGGFGSVLGSVLGAVLITALPQVLSHLAEYSTFLATDNRADHVAVLLYGSALVLFLLFEPEGLAGIWRRAVRRMTPSRSGRPEGSAP